MMRALAVAALVGSATVGAASAQACLSVSDGLGNTTLSCPDGRTGYIHSDGNGAAAGMIGTQPFAGSSTSLAPPFGPPAGSPSTAFIDAPLPPPATPPPPPEPPPVLAPPPPSIATGLTPLQQEALRERAARAPPRDQPAQRP